MNTITKSSLATILVVVFAAGYWFMQTNQGAQGTSAVPPAVQGTSTSQVIETAQALPFGSTTTDGVSMSEELAAAGAPAAAVSVPPSAANEKTIMSATLHTTMGDIEIVFNPETPLTTANFLKLAKSGFYDGTKFHRVIRGFMSQGGDPLSKDDSKADMWGRGGPGYAFADEISARNSNDTDTVAMANSGPNTNGSQFFINAAPNHSLDSKHTVFAKIIKGQDVAAAINAVATGSNDRPLKPVVITGISLR